MPWEELIELLDKAGKSSGGGAGVAKDENTADKTERKSKGKGKKRSKGGGRKEGAG